MTCEGGVQQNVKCESINRFISPWSRCCIYPHYTHLAFRLCIILVFIIAEKVHHKVSIFFVLVIFLAVIQLSLFDSPLSLQNLLLHRARDLLVVDAELREQVGVAFEGF